MEIPAHIGENLPKPVRLAKGSTEEVTTSASKADGLTKKDPFRGSWGLRFLELELSNPTDVVFEISVSVQLENSSDADAPSDDQDATEVGYPKTRIDRDYSARVLIPLEHFKLPVLDGSFFMKDSQAEGGSSGRSLSFSDKTSNAELNASIKNLISRIKVRWLSGRNSSGELNIKDAIQAALQTSVMDILLPDPLTFGVKLANDGGAEHSAKPDSPKDSLVQSPSTCKGSVLSHDMTPMEVVVRNNTMEMIKMRFSIRCRDVAGANCAEGDRATVLWAGKFLTWWFSLSICYLFTRRNGRFIE